MHRKRKNDIIRYRLFLKANGIKLYILSNTNHEEKVKNVANKLQISYINFAKKPFKKGFLKVQSILKEEPSNIAVVGDQIFTDIIGGKKNVYEKNYSMS